MKNLLIALFSIGVLASLTGYLVLHKNTESFILENSVSQYAECYHVSASQVGHQHPGYIYHYHNICEKPKIFTVTYSLLEDPSAPDATYDTICLHPYVYKQLRTDIKVKNIEQRDC